MWNPIETDSVSPLRKPRVFQCGDHPHAEVSRNVTGKYSATSATPHQQAVHDFKMDYAAMANPGTSAKKHNALLTRRHVGKWETPENTVEAKFKQQRDLWTECTIPIIRRKMMLDLEMLSRHVCDIAIGEMIKTYAMQMAGLGVLGRENPPKKWRIKTVADLPADAAQRDPCVLLAYMRPHTRYVVEEVYRKSNTENISFVASFTVNGTAYQGLGRSKKLAKKAAASRACRELFGVVFDTRF